VLARRATRAEPTERSTETAAESRSVLVSRTAKLRRRFGRKNIGGIGGERR